MEFDVNKVYTAVNADELQIGSLIIAALNLEALERNVESEMDIQKLEKIAGIDCGERFGVDIYHDKNNLRYYPLAYLIKPPAEPKYKPFKDIDKAMEAIKKHGGWVKWKDDDIQGLVVGKSDDRVKILQDWVLPEELFEGYVFADDGSTCGELVE